MKIDRLSKLFRTVWFNWITANAIAQVFKSHLAFLYGPPVQLISDKGSQFGIKFFQDVFRILNIRNLLVTIYHPQVNGQVERFDRTMLNTLRSDVADHPKEWDVYTDAIEYAYNTPVYRVTSLSSFELVLSRIPPLVAIESQPTLCTYPSPK